MKRKGLIFLTAACLLLTSCNLLPEETVYQTAPVTKEYAAPEYTLAYARRGDMTLTQKVPVSFMPVQTKSLSFGVGGEYFDEIFVKVGDSVKKGQVLAQLHIEAYENAMESCERQIAALRLSVSQLEEQHKLELERVRLLNADADATTLAEAVEEANESYNTQKKRLDEQIQIQQTVYARYEEEMEKRQIRAPFDGTITYTKTMKAGDVSVKNEGIMTLADSALSLFRANTTLWDSFTEGETYTITCKKNDYEVVVSSEEALGLEVTEKKIGKEGRVYFTLTTPTFELEDGASGALMLTVDQRTDVLMVPEDAVTTANDGYVVYYPNEDGIRVCKSVEVGLVADGMVEIVSGLNEGDCVIVE